MSRPKRFCSIDECGRPCFGHGYCKMHYQRWRKHGDPLAEDHRQYATGRPTNKPEDVWKYVDRRGPDECWPWLGARRRRGYGTFCINLRNYVATRFIYELVHGVDPGELLVCHSCDNPPCVNPAHLFLGTDQDNVLDMHRKGRARPPRGKLTAEDIRQIRTLVAAGQTQVAVAAQFGVSSPHVSRIARGASWGFAT